MANAPGWYLPEQLILKITLIGSEPKIWRRVEVHSGLTLHELHEVIQSVFDWDNSHLYQFLAPAGGKLTQKALREARRYHIDPPDPFLQDHRDLPADESLVGQVLNKDQPLLVYEYDFGDSWEHLVKVEKRRPGGDQDQIPICLAGENAAPTDDMGGIYGFYQWLEALRDPDSDNHEEAVGWLGKNFKPEHFDLAKANRRLKTAFNPVTKKPRKNK